MAFVHTYVLGIYRSLDSALEPYMKWLFSVGRGGDGRKLPVTGRIQAAVGWLPIMSNVNSSAKMGDWQRCVLVYCNSVEQWVFNHFGTTNSFFGRHCFHQLGQRGWFQGDSSPFHLLCTFFLYQLHLRSLDPRGWGNPYSKERCSHLCTIQNA